MAENYVENFSFGEGEDENTFQVKDPEAIEAEGGELANAIITYDNENTSVKSWTDFISNFVSGTKIAKWFKDFRAGVEYVLHVGSLVNNCVTDNSELPLSAAQGKILMDEITQLNSALAQTDDTLTEIADDYIGKKATISYSGADWNDCVVPGFYTLSEAANAPVSTGWVTALVVNYGNNNAYIMQLAFRTSNIYYRGKNGDSSSWTSWNQII